MTSIEAILSKRPGKRVMQPFYLDTFLSRNDRITLLLNYLRRFLALLEKRKTALTGSTNAAQMLVFTDPGLHPITTRRRLDCLPHLPKLAPPLLTGIRSPAAGEMDEQVALMPAHEFAAFGERIDCALLDHSDMVSEGLVVTDKVGLCQKSECYFAVCNRFKYIQASLVLVLATSCARRRDPPTYPGESACTCCDESKSFRH